MNIYPIVEDNTNSVNFGVQPLSVQTHIVSVADQAMKGVQSVPYYSLVILSKVVVIPVLTTIAALVCGVALAVLAVDLAIALCIKSYQPFLAPHAKSILDECKKICYFALEYGFTRKGEELQKVLEEGETPEFVRIMPKIAQENGVPLLYAPGYLDEPETLKSTCRKLANETGAPVYIVKYRSKFQSIEAHSKDLSLVVNRIAVEMNRSDLMLIGHSMGGLVTGHYIGEKAARMNKIKLWVTIGTPHFGTDVANIGLGECARQMRPNSEFLRQFHTNSRLHKVRSLHVYTMTDHIVPFKGCPAFGEHYECKAHTGHLGVRMDPDVHCKILRLIQSVNG